MEKQGDVNGLPFNISQGGDKRSQLHSAQLSGCMHFFQFIGRLTGAGTHLWIKTGRYL
jgi:hypothetical protein